MASDNPYSAEEYHKLTGMSVAHAAVLRERGVLPHVAWLRGYRTLTSRAQVQKHGFSGSQASTVKHGQHEALLIPVVWPAVVSNWEAPMGSHDDLLAARMDRVAAQVRPDVPRIVSGKKFKYETTASHRAGGRGTGSHLDSPPSTWAAVGDVNKPLLITEGPIKGDAIASAAIEEDLDVGVVSVLGVEMWRHCDDELNMIPWAGRRVFIAFDNDWKTNRRVHQALSDLAAHLEKKKAKVFWLDLPDVGPPGAKTGIDDYLAADLDNTLMRLLENPISELPVGDFPPIETPSSGNGMFVNEDTFSVIKETTTAQGARSHVVTDWCWRITEIVEPMSLQDKNEAGHGLEPKYTIMVCYLDNEGRAVEIERVVENSDLDDPSKLRGLVPALAHRAIPQAGAEKVQWVNACRLWGAEYSRHVIEWQHTGWVPRGEQWFYADGNRGIGPAGTEEAIRVNSGAASSLADFQLPDVGHGTDISSQVQAGLRAGNQLFRLFADSSYFYVHLGVVFSSVIPGRRPQCTLINVGPPAAGKTWAVFHAIMAFFGYFKDEAPESFGSTAAALESAAANWAHSPLFIDDLPPTSDQRRRSEVAKLYETIVRDVWNGRSRTRMSPDMTRRPSFPQRCFTVLTAEFTPNDSANLSLLQRSLILPFQKPMKMVDGVAVADRSRSTLDSEVVAEIERHMTTGDDDHHMLPYLTADFVWWLARRLDSLSSSGFIQERARLERGIEEACVSLGEVRDRELVMKFGLGWYYFEMYLDEMHPGWRQRQGDRWDADTALHRIQSAVAAASTRRVESSPVEMFRSTLAAGLSRGQFHVAMLDGQAPPAGREQLLGWQFDPVSATWRPRGEAVAQMFRSSDGTEVLGFSTQGLIESLNRVSPNSFPKGNAALLVELRDHGLLYAGDWPARGQFARSVTVPGAVTESGAPSRRQFVVIKYGDVFTQDVMSEITESFKQLVPDDDGELTALTDGDADASWDSFDDGWG